MLHEVVRRVCRYAESQQEDVEVLLDAGGPMPREEAITTLAQFIYSGDEPSLRRIVEVPMELESHRYGAMQLADWICAIATRASHFHLSASNEFGWAPSVLGEVFRDRTTRESRIWLPDKRMRITPNQLSDPRKWITSSVSRPKQLPRLTQRIQFDGLEKLIDSQ